MLIRFDCALPRVLLIGALFTSPSIAANNANMRKLFTVDSSCGDLDPLLDDTLALARGALDAIQVLQNTDRFALGSTARNYMRNMHSCFGTTYKFFFSRGGLSDADRDIANKVADNYQRIVNALQTDLRPNNNLIVCDHRRYQQTFNLGDIDKNPGTDFNVQVRSGIWYIPGYLDSATQVERAALLTSRPPCDKPNAGGLTIAETYVREASGQFEYKQVMLCDAFRLYLDHNELQSAHNDPKNAPGNNGEATSLIDNYSSMAGVFLHELLHLLADDPNNWEDHPFTYRRKPGKTYQPYGAANIYAVANRRSRATPADPSLPFDVLGFPDAYALFAESCYIDKKWSRSSGGPRKRMVTLEEGEAFMASNSSST